MDKFYSKKAFLGLSKLYSMSFFKGQPFFYLEKQASKFNVRDYRFYNLMPRKELIEVVDSPCEKNVKWTKGNNVKLMTAYKKLRQILNVEEEKTCSRCPLAKSCHMANKTPTNKGASSKDLALILYAIADKIDIG